MDRAIELAYLGEGSVEPNPMVGAVIVDDDLNLVSEGYHHAYGGPHAEIEALSKIDSQAQGKTLVVTLEPCSHQGKTGPCSQAVIQSGIKKVYIGIQDPAAHVNGKGIRDLENAGIEVKTGIREKEVRRLMAPFIQVQEKGLPYILAKWAMTLDGKIASRTGHSQWISNEQSRERVHQLRGRMDAILVGIDTALKDDPLLTARPEGKRTATRIVIDKEGILPLDSNLVKSIDQAPLLLVTGSTSKADQLEKLKKAGAEILIVPWRKDSQSRLDLTYLCTELAKKGMTNVLVEGGGKILGSFFDEKLINEVHVFIADKLVGGDEAVTPVAGEGLDVIPEVPQLITRTVEYLDNDLYIHGQVDLNS